MFDDAYIVEASLTVAELIKKRCWDKIMKADFSKPIPKEFFLMIEIERCENALVYWGIFYGTHGV